MAIGTLGSSQTRSGAGVGVGVGGSGVAVSVGMGVGTGMGVLSAQPATKALSISKVAAILDMEASQLSVIGFPGTPPRVLLLQTLNRRFRPLETLLQQSHHIWVVNA